MHTARLKLPEKLALHRVAYARAIFIQIRRREVNIDKTLPLRSNAATQLSLKGPGFRHAE